MTNKPDVFGLIDCNNFYASCERVFKPKLNGRPIIVLSNNDGCVIARSNEAKEAGVQMGQPYFECEPLVKKHKIAVFSSNFTLYGDFSARVMEILEKFGTDIEIYSIDEAFINLKNIPANEIIPYSQLMRKTIKQWTGIPVSIGIGPTKTLAKLANKVAKKQLEYKGVFNFTNNSKQHEFFANMDVGQIWGIGYRLTKFLKLYGIDTVLKFVQTDEEWIKENLGVNGTRILLELKGIPKIQMEQKPEAQKSIITSRSFRKPITGRPALEEAVATFMSRATEKLRQQQCVASYVQVYISTGYHQKGEHYRNHYGMELPFPTASTPHFIATGKECVKKIFKWGFGYKKAGVVLTGIVPKRYQQFDLFTPHENHQKQETIMKIIDHANWRWGTDTLKYGATGIKRNWGYRQEKRSPNYTTRWDELFTITI